MQDAGYQYVNIDDCWQGRQRDANGFISAQPEQFPGMKALADYVHGRGLKLGIYSDRGTADLRRARRQPGHERQDARTYAAWGVDYLKYDWCSRRRDGRIQRAIRAMARGDARDRAADGVQHLRWGTTKPWMWATRVGNLWRTTGDISDTGCDQVERHRLIMPAQTTALAPYAGPGHWNDPDMLEVGNGGMTVPPSTART